MFHMMKGQRKNIGGNSNQKIEIKALRKKRDAFFLAPYPEIILFDVITHRIIRKKPFVFNEKLGHF